jgi:hypothetical protein
MERLVTVDCRCNETKCMDATSIIISSYFYIFVFSVSRPPPPPPQTTNMMMHDFFQQQQQQKRHEQHQQRQEHRDDSDTVASCWAFGLLLKISATLCLASLSSSSIMQFVRGPVTNEYVDFLSRITPVHGKISITAWNNDDDDDKTSIKNSL